MALFFTSDLHLGHANAIKFTARPFVDVDDMNKKLIRNINETVGMRDELWILGDFSYKMTRDDAAAWRKKIVCKQVHLVRGNHDKDWQDMGVFTSVQDYAELKTGYGKVVLFHYPILDWNGKHNGSIHLHGHIHSTGEYNKAMLTADSRQFFPEGHSGAGEAYAPRMYDVGVDANGYRPISIDEIAARMSVTTSA